MKNQNGCISARGVSWVLRWRDPVETDGKRKFKFKVLGPVTGDHRRNKDRATGKLRIPTEIQAAADEIMGAVKTSPMSPLTTIGEFVTDYLRDRETTLTRGTYAGYTQLWGTYLSPRIGRLVLRDFKRPDAYLLWQQIVKAYPALSRQTLNHMRFFLSGVFKAALNRGLYTGDNPASADLPNGLRGRGETHAYSVEDVTRMLVIFAGDSKAQAIIGLGFGSGMRKGELSGCRWQDYEATETGAIIHVRQANWRGTIVKPKTTSSADDVHLGLEVCEFVEAYRQSIGNPTEGLMFGYAADKPINLDSYVRWTIRPKLKAAGMQWYGFHALRRGNATFLAKNIGGDGVRAASLMLRHAHEGITADHYIKNTRQERRALAARKVVEISEQRTAAAATIGAGLRQVN